MGRWSWLRPSRQEPPTRATIATAAVKAQALALVADLRANLDRLEETLESATEIVQRATAMDQTDGDPHAKEPDDHRA